MRPRPVVVWLRNDLRLADHRALAAAVATGAPLVFVYILDDETPGAWKRGAASRWWLDKSLAALDGALRARGGRLTLRRGAATQVLPRLVADCDAQAVYFTRAYEPHAVAVEDILKVTFDAVGVAFKRFG
ncbi:MAG: deoxyribodipyrimidine photo-lyase, partial [Hyphomicrobium sp.]